MLGVGSPLCPLLPVVSQVVQPGFTGRSCAGGERVSGRPTTAGDNVQHVPTHIPYWSHNVLDEPWRDVYHTHT